LKIEIKNRFSGKVLFDYEQEENSVKITLEAGIKECVDLSYAHLRGADLSGADMRGADLNGADLRGADLSYAHLSGADLRDAYLGDVHLRGAHLSGAHLSGTAQVGADMRGAHLSGANLSGAELSYAHLSGANLRGADLSYANLNSADLRGAHLSGADLRGAYLNSATYGEGVIIGNNPLFILGLTWQVYIFETHIKIGCHIHTKQEWLEFNDADIAKMEPRAPVFWAKWKKHILWMAFEGAHCIKIDLIDRVQGELMGAYCCDSCTIHAGYTPKYPADSGVESWLCEVCGQYNIGSMMDYKIGDWLTLLPLQPNVELMGAHCDRRTR